MGEEKASCDSESNSAVAGITNSKAENTKTLNSESQDEEISQENSNSKGENCTDVKSTDSKDSTNESNETEKEPQLCLAPTNNQFKLRIVPIEKLLEKPLNEKDRSQSPSVKESNGRKDSVIELSDSEEGSGNGNEDQELVKPKKQKKATECETTATEKTVDRKATENVVAGNDTQLGTFKRKVCVRLKRVTLSSGSEKAPLKDTSVSTRSVAAKMNKSKSSKEKPSSSKRKLPTSDSEDSDFESSKKATTNTDAKADAGSEDATSEPLNNHSSDSKSSSESEIIPIRKKRVFTKKKSESGGNDSDFRPDNHQPEKKRRRIKNEKDSAASDSGSDDEQNKNKRKHIRKIIKTKDLDISTKTAAKEEEERRTRIEERQKLYNQLYEKPDSVEVAELVLDFDEESKKTLLEVDKGLLKKLKPHQVSGIKFMWDACFETVADTQEKPGSGCILAHCMGLGKTLQIVTLSHTLLSNSRKTNVERVLIISPLSTLNNWAREFKNWISFARKKNIEIYDMSKYKDKPTRIYKLNEWFDEGGVCIMGYDMYRILANEKAKGLRKPQRETLKKSLIDPGPDMVVCDEGHLLKNEKTSISQAVTKIRTRRRIVLTGTPLQNNLKEYYCMIQFIKPNLLGTYKEYLNRFVNPITNGQYTDSTERDIRLMKHRSHILHNMLEGCIQRRDYSVLAPYLPPKHEYVVYTTLSELQQQLYEYYMNTQRDLISSDIGGKGARLFQDFQDLRRIWTHPMSLRYNSDSVIRKRIMADDSDSIDDFIDDEDDESSNSSDSTESSAASVSRAAGKSGSSKKGDGRKIQNNPNKKDSDLEEPAAAAKEDPSEWWKKFVEEKELNNINHSPKLLILMRLIVQCEAIGDKLLVFSQSLQSLDVIEHFLSLINSKTKGHDYEGDVGDCKGYWTIGKDYFRLDGSCSVEQREAMCKKFNDKNNLRARLFLISTRAGGLGINLVAANRVVIFDVSWNPSHDTQSIFRVYRFGQEKPCYIYRLIAMGTMEQKVYERQVAKQATAKRVIDEQQISRHYNQSDLQELYTFELKPLTPRETPILPKDRLFAELLTEHEKLLFKYHEHDSLLENEESENLSEDERKAAWSEYEAEKTRSAQAAQYISYDRNAFGNQFGNAAGSVTSNKIFGFRSDVILQLLNMKIAQDHPELNQNQVIQLVPGYLQRLYAEMNSGDPTLYKELLALHATIAQPSGMYMNPLLYANQNTEAAGYMQTPTPYMNNMVPPPILQRPPPVFNPDEVYEID